jgi:hypothetical protein
VRRCREHLLAAQGMDLARQERAIGRMDLTDTLEPLEPLHDNDVAVRGALPCPLPCHPCVRVAHVPGE